MRFFNIKSVKFKIVFFTTVCLMAVGLFSHLYLYTYMNKMILEKADSIDSLYLDIIQSQLDARFEEINMLGILCANNNEVSRGMDNTSMEALYSKQRIFAAQRVLNDYLRYVNFSTSYVNKLLAINDAGLSIQAYAMYEGHSLDTQNLIHSPIFANRRLPASSKWTVSNSISPHKPPCFSALFPVNSNMVPTRESYIYIELDQSMVTDIITPYAKLNPIFLVTDRGDVVPSKDWEEPSLFSGNMLDLKNGDILESPDGVPYRVDIRPLETPGLFVYSCLNLTLASLDNRKMVYTLMVVTLSVLLVSICILSIISNYITRPIQRLIARIKKISANDFSYDPSIEISGDEIGEIGKVVNEMNLSIANLLKERVEQSEQKKNIEINLLQTQVNPHFLYNTLDSIHWMAIIQKNSGICNITHALSNLLKNMAKGFSQKISLEEELGLLNDYVTIQSIRYLETFELVNHIGKSFYHYAIVKLTLQPLIENAIFHGIEPSGKYGTITLDAKEDGEFLLITVEDSGVGMPPEVLENFKNVTHKGTSNSMNGIGLANVHERLRLVYGAGCGLTLQSELGLYTKITVRIRKEDE